ncbi:MAG: UDP-N-acetylmuramoyl-tripeptide--D-alanyl-D-alanine ligase [Candidatus Melainabacteria bacterium]|nr:UDP-N-acetylmuramoyl-tripeptide--D-alanyl-D-alanine ligase [Candidatus Melainabacteria bacterium]
MHSTTPRTESGTESALAGAAASALGAPSLGARFSHQDICQALGVSPQNASPQNEATDFPAPARLCTDSRDLRAGDVFLAIVGANYDGHSFVRQAYQQGAVGVIVSNPHSVPENATNAWCVEETTVAFLKLARHHRLRCNAKVIALTGSSGKTTVKELLTAALSPLAKTQCSAKNHNNEIGVAQTLLSLEADTAFLVVEMGMRGPDQIALLARHAVPDIGLVINVGPAHIEFLGSLEAIAKAKCELLEHLLPERQAVGIVNGDDMQLMARAEVVCRQKALPLKTFRLQHATAITPSETGTVFTYQGQPIRLALAGTHQISNALAVLAVGDALGYSAEQLAPGLETLTPPEGRGNRVRLAGWNNAWLLNDAYNANPASVQASLDAFIGRPKQAERWVLVMGGMKELGSHSKDYHLSLGASLAKMPLLDALIAVGEEAPWLLEGFEQTRRTLTPDVPHPIATQAATATEVPDQLRTLGFKTLEETEILLKGSRTNQLEQLIELLTKERFLNGGNG